MSVLIRAGVRRRLPALVESLRAARVLVVASPRAARSSGVLDLRACAEVRQFTGFTPNPTIEQVLAGSGVRASWRPDLIVAAGGGSALDTAKLLRSLPASMDGALEVLSGRRPPDEHRPPLIALPTTAGSGSEVTRFATVYVRGVKASLDHDSVLPDHALVDPDLLSDCPRRLASSCAFDALCHAVESYWSRRACPFSRALALAALRQLIPLLAGGRLTVSDGDGRDRLAHAATTAGLAIDHTRTTAAHAFAYKLTADHGVHHGTACLLNLIWVYRYNMRHLDPMPELAQALAALAPDGDVPAGLRALLTRAGLPDRLGAYGVRRRHLAALAEAGTCSARSANNPVDVTGGTAVGELATML
jgi:alcohol dehydrogenase class IV